MTLTSEIVKLNIGGTLFHTTKATLTRFDGFFRTILETDVPITKDDSGAFFIDRSPKHFDSILNFMRDGDVELPTCKRETEEISKEAQYYLLTRLVELCTIPSQAKPSTEIVRVLHSGIEEVAAVVNSEKPVVVIPLRDSYEFYELRYNDNANDWKQFVKRHSLKWNIFIKKIETDVDRDELALYADAKKTFICNGSDTGYNQCRLRRTTMLDHLEHHMNKFLKE